MGYQQERGKLQDKLHCDHLVKHKAYLQFHKEREVREKELQQGHLAKHRAYAGD